MRRIPYPLLCTALGLAVGWIPGLLHGPIAAKWDFFHLDGAAIVRGWYAARLSIGLLVGITVVPRAWWLRGPACGVLAMLPVGLVSLGNPYCGLPCMGTNVLTGMAVGLFVAAAARAMTGRDHGAAGPR